jgi:hypothetical protein
MTVEWGIGRAGAFAVLRDGDQAPITLGFQGFRFVAGAARIIGTQATSATFRFDVEVDGHEASSQSAGRIDLVPASDGALYADGLQLFFNDIPLASVLGRDVNVTLAAGANGCAASHRARVELVRGCDQLQDGATTCDAGP